MGGSAVTALTLGAVAGLGLLLICLGLTRPAAIPSDRGRLPQLTAGVVVGLVAAVGVWLVCGWPVLTLAALAGGLLVPRWWAYRAETTALASRSEAIAEVAAGLRDAIRGGLGVTDALAAWPAGDRWRCDPPLVSWPPTRPPLASPPPWRASRGGWPTHWPMCWRPP
jgi:hypothetical protein